MNEKQQFKADFMLVLVAMCWGISYYLIDVCLSDMGPFTLNAYRFIIAFAVAFIFAFPKLRTVNKITLRYSFYVGTMLITVYISATYGVMYTSLSNAGFLCALTVVFTPLLDFLIKKKKPTRKLMFVVLLCIVGIALLSLNEQLKPALGDLFCLICALTYAVHLLLTETAVKKEEVNAFQLGVYQLGFVGVVNLIIALIVEEPHLPETTSVLWAVLFLAVFCTGVAFIVQAIAQQYTSATHVGVIFTLEPVFAGAVAFFLAGEILLPRAYLGAGLLLLGLVVMEIDLKKLLRKLFN